MLSPSPFPGSAPGLLTGHAEIDQEHRLLLSTLGRLREACLRFDEPRDCGGCDALTAAQCHNTLVELLGDLLMFLIEHFQKEEAIMKESGLTTREREVCERHKEDHAAISQTILDIVTALDPAQTAHLVRSLHTVLERWQHNHIRLHDQILVRLLPPAL